MLELCCALLQHPQPRHRRFLQSSRGAVPAHPSLVHPRLRASVRISLHYPHRQAACHRKLLAVHTAKLRTDQLDVDRACFLGEILGVREREEHLHFSMMSEADDAEPAEQLVLVLVDVLDRLLVERAPQALAVADVLGEERGVVDELVHRDAELQMHVVAVTSRSRKNQ